MPAHRMVMAAGIALDIFPLEDSSFVGTVRLVAKFGDFALHYKATSANVAANTTKIVAAGVCR